MPFPLPANPDGTSSDGVPAHHHQVQDIDGLYTAPEEDAPSFVLLFENGLV